MGSMSLAQLAQPLQGVLHGPDRFFTSVSTDSRQIRKGELYVALSGENFDGNDFAAAAFDAGAVAALVSRVPAGEGSYLAVSDTLTALGHMAALNRERSNVPVIAITGSGGKTTVKNMVAAILGQQFSTLATEGNFNNEIGVPLTLLRLSPEHEVAVVEMGAAKAGDIRYLCRLAHPDIAILNNVLPAHLDGFGSVDGIAHAKSEILEGLGGVGTAVYPAESAYVDVFKRAAATADQISFGFSPSADVQASNVVAGIGGGTKFEIQTTHGSAVIDLPLLGEHNVLNALAATAACLAAGASLSSVVAGLSGVRAAPGRLVPLALRGGGLLIDDSYNANPEAVNAAIDVLAEMPGPRLLILGAMAELGPDSINLHRQVFDHAFARDIDEVWAVGADAVAAAGDSSHVSRCYADVETLVADQGVDPGNFATVLVKGSRSSRMEVAVNCLVEEDD